MGDDVVDVVAGCAVLLSDVLPPGVHTLMTCFYLYEKRVVALKIAQMTFYIPA